jgi:hypothetical protein
MGNKSLTLEQSQRVKTYIEHQKNLEDDKLDKEYQELILCYDMLDDKIKSILDSSVLSDEKISSLNCLLLFNDRSDSKEYNLCYQVLSRLELDLLEFRAQWRNEKYKQRRENIKSIVRDCHNKISSCIDQIRKTQTLEHKNQIVTEFKRQFGDTYVLCGNKSKRKLHYYTNNGYNFYIKIPGMYKEIDFPYKNRISNYFKEYLTYSSTLCFIFYDDITNLIVEYSGEILPVPYKKENLTLKQKFQYSLLIDRPSLTLRVNRDGFVSTLQSIYDFAEKS